MADWTGLAGGGDDDAAGDAPAEPAAVAAKVDLFMCVQAARAA